MVLRCDARPFRAAPTSIGHPSVARYFAATVARETRGPVLRYPVRQNLLNRAAKLGIPRFDANLIIAAAENRTHVSLEARVQSRIHRDYSLFGMFLAIQSVIVAAGWFVLH
jgi:hypothetical protein